MNFRRGERTIDKRFSEKGTVTAVSDEFVEVLRDDGGVFLRYMGEDLERLIIDSGLVPTTSPYKFRPGEEVCHRETGEHALVIFVLLSGSRGVFYTVFWEANRGVSIIREMDLT